MTTIPHPADEAERTGFLSGRPLPFSIDTFTPIGMATQMFAVKDADGKTVFIGRKSTCEQVITAVNLTPAFDTMREALKEATAERDLLRAALEAARDHLDYCGYGDTWERECADAQGLSKMIEAALAIGEPVLTPPLPPFMNSKARRSAKKKRARAALKLTEPNHD